MLGAPDASASEELLQYVTIKLDRVCKLLVTQNPELCLSLSSASHHAKPCHAILLECMLLPSRGHACSELDRFNLKQC